MTYRPKHKHDKLIIY